MEFFESILKFENNFENKIKNNLKIFNVNIKNLSKKIEIKNEEINKNNQIILNEILNSENLLKLLNSKKKIFD